MCGPVIALFKNYFSFIYLFLTFKNLPYKLQTIDVCAIHSHVKGLFLFAQFTCSWSLCIQIHKKHHTKDAVENIPTLYT